MYYELYIDILYLVNFMMDFLILLLVKEITKSSTTLLRMTIASLLGALLTCIVLILPNVNVVIKFVFFHVVINTVMIRTGFEIKDRRGFIKCLVSLYFSSFLIGGVLQYFQQYLKISSLFFAMTIVSYWIVRGLWSMVIGISSNRDRWYDVEVFNGKKSTVVKALLDTGNGLYDPCTGRAVSVVYKTSVEDLFDYSKEYSGLPEKGRFIPYHSLGYQGLIAVVKVDKLHIVGTDEYWIDTPLLALSEEPVSVKQCYQMILNPDIL